MVLFWLYDLIWKMPKAIPKLLSQNKLPKITTGPMWSFPKMKNSIGSIIILVEKEQNKVYASDKNCLFLYWHLLTKIK